MATFNEIYNNYLSGVQGTAPISGQQGITSLATPANSNGGADGAGDGGDGYAMGGRIGYADGTPTEDFSDYLNKDTSSNILKDLYLKDIGIDGINDESPLNILQKYLDLNKNIKGNTALNEYVEGARSGYLSSYVDPYAEGFNLEKDYFNSSNNLGILDIAYDPRSGKLTYYDKNEGPYGAHKYYSGDLVDQDFVDSFGLKLYDPKYRRENVSTQAYGPTPTPNTSSVNTIAQTTPKTPTEDFSDYLNTPTIAEQIMSPDDSMNQDIDATNAGVPDSNLFQEGITALTPYYDSTSDRLENVFNNPAIKGFANFVTGAGSPFQDISQLTSSQQDVINQSIQNAAKEGRTNITYADYPKTGVAQLMDDGFSPMEYIKTLGSSMIGNPVDQIKTAFGQYNVDPQKQQLKDLYNFQKQSGDAMGTPYPINMNISNPKQTYQAERPLQSAFERFVGASGPLANNINTAVGGLNSSQRQQYMNYAVQNPDKAIAAAQQNKDFMAATQRNTTPPAMANGGRVSYLQGGLVSLLGDYYGKR